MADSTLNAVITLDDQMSRTLKQIEGNVGVLNRSASKATEAIAKGFANVKQRVEDIGKSVKDAGKKMTLFVTTPLIGAGVAGLKAAMDMEATNAKFETVFGNMTSDADKFIKEFQKLTPATKAQARNMASGIQDLLIPMGIAREDATSMTGKFMHVAGALQAFNSGTHDTQRVMDAMNSALTGSFEPLKSLGIQLDVETARQKAVEMGLAETTKEVSKQAMAQVALAEIYNQSGDALAAYSEENLDAGTRIAILRGRVVDMASDLFTRFIPAIHRVIDIVSDWMTKFEELDDGTKKMILKVGAFIAAIGPLLIVVGTLITLFTVLLSPIGLVAVAIAGLGVWLAKQENPMQVIRDLLGNLRQRFKDLTPFIDFAKTAFEKVRSIVNILIPIFIYLVSQVLSSLFHAWDRLKGPVRDFMRAVQDLWRAISPIVKMILGIVGVGLVVGFQVAFAILINVIAGFIRFFSGIIRVVSGIVNVIVGLFTGNFSRMGEGVKQIFWGLWGVVRGIAGMLFSPFSGAFDGIMNHIRGLNWWRVGLDIVNGIIGGLGSLGSRLGSTIRNAIPAGMRNLIPGFASGTNFVPETGMYTVGERGPEQVILPRGSRVTRASDSAQGGGGQNTININVTSGMGADGREIADMIRRVINQDQRLARLI